MKKLSLILAILFLYSCSSEEISVEPYDWSTKKVVWLGTSISENYRGEGNDIIEKIENSYPNKLADVIGFEIVNNSRRGLASALNSDGTLLPYGSLSASILEYENPEINVDNIPLLGGEDNRYRLRSYENALLNQEGDVYVFDLVPNNINFNTSEWDKFNFETHQFNDGSTFLDNRTTYLGSILFLYNELKNENPMANVIFVTVYEMDHEGVQDTILAAEKLNVPIINVRELMNNLGIEYITHDFVHPTQETVDHISEILIPFFEEINFNK